MSCHLPGWLAQHLWMPVVWLMWSVTAAYTAQECACLYLCDFMYLCILCVCLWLILNILNLVAGGDFVVILPADSCVSEPMNSITGVENKRIKSARNQSKSNVLSIKWGGIWAKTTRETVYNENNPHMPPTHTHTHTHWFIICQRRCEYIRTPPPPPSPTPLHTNTTCHSHTFPCAV